MKNRDLPDTRPLTIPGESGGVTTPITTDPTPRHTEVADIDAGIIVHGTNRKQPDQPWLAASEGNIDAIQHRLDNLQMSWYM